MQRAAVGPGGAFARRIALAGLLLAAPAALAQEPGGSPAPDPAESAAPSDSQRRIHDLTTPESSVESGLFWSADDSFAFGNYTGLEDSGFSFLGNADVELRTPWDAPDPTYYHLQALNLGLDSRQVFSEFEKPGRFGVFFGFDELPVLWSDEVQTIFFKEGDSDFSLPAGWVPGATPADMTLFGTSLRDQSSRFRRRTVGGGFSVVLPESLDFDAGYDRQRKKGRYFENGTMGLTGGNPRSVALNERFDYTTDLWETALRYAIEQLQLQVEYQGSHFEDHADSVTFVNPYTANSAWNPNAGFPQAGVPCFDVPTPGCGLGRKAQPPDNWFNQIIGSGGYSLPFWNTRVTGNAAFGWMKQDDSFLPYTVNDALVVTAPVPRSDLDGEIHTTLLNFRVDSRPLPDARLDLNYRYDDRDNDTPRDIYIYIRNDSEDQGTISSGQARIPRPYSFRPHELDFDATYTVVERTDLTLGYEWEQWHRSMQEASKVWDNSVFARVVSHPWSWLAARTEYQHGWQDHSTYNGVRPLYYGNSPESMVGFDPATDFENHPLLRKFYMARSQKDELRSMITLIPHEEVSVALSTNWVHDDFDDADLGLQEMDTVTSGIDVTWMPIERLTASVFYNFERFVAHQDSWSFSDVPTSQNPARRWSGRDRDLGHTAGLAVHVDVLPERLGLDTQFLFAQTKGLTGIVRGTGLVAPGLDPPFPDDRTRIWDLSVRADYRIRDGIGVRLGYLFERLDTKNWALDGVSPGNLSCSTNACVISSGQQSPDATTHLVTWSIYYDFYW